MFKQYVGRGFILYVEGPAGPDGRKRETTPVSCRAEDYPEVLKTVMEGEKWIKQDESLVPPDSIHLYSRPSTGKKNFTILVKQSDHVRTVYFVPDQKANGVSLMPGKDAREFLD